MLLALEQALIPAGDTEKAAAFATEEAFILTDAPQDHDRAVHACRLWIDAIGRVSVEADYTMGGRLSSERRFGEALRLLRQGYILSTEMGDTAVMLAAGHDTLPNLWAPKTHQEQVRFAYELCERQWPGASTRHLAAMLYMCGFALVAAGNRPRAQEKWKELSLLGERTQDSTALGRSLAVQAQEALLDGRFDRVGEVTEMAANHPKDVARNDAARQLRTGDWPRALFFLGGLRRR